MKYQRFIYVVFVVKHDSYMCLHVMQGAPLDQMGARYPHMLLILLLLHGANAASHAPVQKWQTLGGKHLCFLFYC